MGLLITHNQSPIIEGWLEVQFCECRLVGWVGFHVLNDLFLIHFA